MFELLVIVFIIWVIIKIISWLIKQLPVILMGFLIILGVGGLIGLLVGTFYGVRNYVLSIHENIRNKALKITMMFITSVYILALLGAFVYLSPVKGQFGLLMNRISSYSKPSVNSNNAANTETFTNKIVDTYGLNVRDGPSVDYKIKDELPQGTIVKVLDEYKSGDWVKIKYNNDKNEGYVNQRYLREVGR